MKDFIKQKLREDLEYHHASDATKDEYVIGENNNMNKYIKLGLDNQFDSKEHSINHLKNIINELESLPNVVKLYRVVFVNDPSEINNKEVGSHYVLKKEYLEASHHQISHVGGGKPYLLTVKVDKSLIDVDETIKTRMIYPGEEEITIKGKGKGVKIINVTPFETSDDEMDLLGTADDFDFY